MNIHKFTLYVAPEDIYNTIIPNQREQIGNVIITSADLHGDGCVHIECVALEEKSEITELPYRQSLLSDNGNNTYITVIEN